MLKIGETPYISTLPLYFPLHTRLGAEYELVSGRLTELSASLAKGEIDAGPITLVEYLRNPDQYKVLPRMSLSSLGRSGCVLLFSRKPVYELGNAVRIAVPGWAVGAVALMRWLMKEMYRFEPKLVERKTDNVAESLAENDAVLMFQDQALLASTSTSDLLHIWDLGEAWWQITNTPLIYTLWVVRRDLPESAIATLTSIFDEAKTADRGPTVAEAQRLTNLPASVLEGYLGRFNYDFTPAHQEGLDFYGQTVAALAIA